MYDKISHLLYLVAPFHFEKEYSILEKSICTERIKTEIPKMKDIFHSDKLITNLHFKITY